MFCRYCGRKIEKDSKFCAFCGKGLETLEEQSPADAVSPAEAPSREMPSVPPAEPLGTQEPSPDHTPGREKTAAPPAEVPAPPANAPYQTPLCAAPAAHPAEPAGQRPYTNDVTQTKLVSNMTFGEHFKKMCKLLTFGRE